MLLSYPPPNEDRRELPSEEESGVEANGPIKFARRWLHSRFELRFNELTLEYECRERNGQVDFEPVDPEVLWLRLEEEGNLKLPEKKVLAIIKDSRYTPRYNPIRAYFEALPPWDGVNHIRAIASFVYVEEGQEVFETHLKKHMIRSIACALEPNAFNKQALVLIGGKHDTGKTTFIRWFCPPELEAFITDEMDFDHKDGLISLCKNFMINLEELASVSNVKTQESLKKAFSTSLVKVRLPYERTAKTMPRIASFWASTNRTDFLKDETGSVRWLCFRLNSLDWAYKTTCDVNLAWSQAYAAYQAGETGKLTAEEREESEKRNKAYYGLGAEGELILEYMEPCEDDDYQAHRMTATRIMLELTYKSQHKALNEYRVGRALAVLGFEQIRKRDPNGTSGTEKTTQPLRLWIFKWKK